jgi:hypothetical protein
MRGEFQCRNRLFIRSTIPSQTAPTPKKKSKYQPCGKSVTPVAVKASRRPIWALSRRRMRRTTIGWKTTRTVVSISPATSARAWVAWRSPTNNGLMLTPTFGTATNRIWTKKRHTKLNAAPNADTSDSAKTMPAACGLASL